MSNLTKGIPPQPYGQGGRKVYLPLKATQQVYEGGMAAQISGACVPATTAASGHCIGVYESDALGGASDGSARVSVWTDKIFVFNAGVHAPTDATPFGTVLFAEDDHSVGTGAGGETQIAGRFMGIEDDGRVRVYISNQASWFDTNANLDDGGNARFKCRAVITSLGVNTGTTTGTLTVTATGAMPAQDGITLVAGDLVFIQEGTTHLAAASDAGPYVVVNPGASLVSPVLTRPSWWQTGAAITQGQTIEVGGEGTFWAGTTWKTFVAKGKIVDTDAPVFWVREVTQPITFVAGNNGTAVVNNVGIRSATESNVSTNLTTLGGTNTGIFNFASMAITPGVFGAGSFTLTAIGSALAAISVATTSTVNVTIENW